MLCSLELSIIPSPSDGLQVFGVTFIANVECAAIIRPYHKQCGKTACRMKSSSILSVFWDTRRILHFQIQNAPENALKKSVFPPNAEVKPIWELLHMHKSAVKLAALLQLLSCFRFLSFHFSASHYRSHSRYSRWPLCSCTTGHENIALGYTIRIILSWNFLLWCILEKRYANRYDCGRW